jgi:hypothetical protein
VFTDSIIYFLRALVFVFIVILALERGEEQGSRGYRLLCLNENV